MMSESAYPMPVVGLLSVGDPRGNDAAERIAALSLDQEHVPDLVRMAVSLELNNAPSDSLEIWAPLHALRELKQLDASAHAADLLPLIDLDEDDWFRTELPNVFAHIGRPALVPLKAYLADHTRSDRSHSTVVCALGQIGQQHPDLRDEAVALLSDVLNHAEQYDELSCSFAMSALVDLDAVEALPAIRHAFTLDKIDPMVRGDWGDILDQFGIDAAPDDPLIALSQQRVKEWREQVFPNLRQTLQDLGIADESAFARLALQQFGTPGLVDAASDDLSSLQHGQAQAQKERQRRTEAAARKQKQKRKASSAARKANQKKRK
jgi:hypothetical protein